MDKWERFVGNLGGPNFMNETKQIGNQSIFFE